MPIFPELRPYLLDVFEQAEEGTECVITRYRNQKCNLRSQLMRIIGRAGLDQWPRLFHNLRSSRQTELVKAHPVHVVCAWLDNSKLIAKEHYLQVTDDDFAQAIADSAEAARQTAQQAPVSHGTPTQNKKPQTQNRPVLPSDSAPCECSQDVKVTPTGFEHAANKSAKVQNAGEGSAESGAFGDSVDNGVASIVNAWPKLPPAIRADIARLVRQSKVTSGGD